MGAYNKLISILLKFIADRGRAFSLPYRFLNLDRYAFPIRITAGTVIQVEKNDNLQLEINMFLENISTFGKIPNTLKGVNKSKCISLNALERTNKSKHAH